MAANLIDFPLPHSKPGTASANDTEDQSSRRSSPAFESIGRVNVAAHARALARLAERQRSQAELQAQLDRVEREHKAELQQARKISRAMGFRDGFKQGVAWGMFCSTVACVTLGGLLGFLSHSVGIL